MGLITSGLDSLVATATLRKSTRDLTLALQLVTCQDYRFEVLHLRVLSGDFSRLRMIATGFQVFQSQEDKTLALVDMCSNLQGLFMEPKAPSHRHMSSSAVRSMRMVQTGSWPVAIYFTSRPPSVFGKYLCLPLSASNASDCQRGHRRLDQVVDWNAVKMILSLPTTTDLSSTAHLTKGVSCASEDEMRDSFHG